MEYKKITLRTNEELKGKIVEYAKKENISINHLILKVIKDIILNHQDL